MVDKIAEKLGRTVVAVPPVAWTRSLDLAEDQNRRLIGHIEAGGVGALLYGGNANLYHFDLGRFAALMDLLTEAPSAATDVIPSIGIAEDRLGAEEDIAFHLAIARATENDYYQRTIASVTKAIRVGMSIAATLSTRPPPQRLGIATGEHRGVLDAIRASDPDLARARMRAHIEGARKRVFVGGS